MSRGLASDYLFAYAEFGTYRPIQVLAGLHAVDYLVVFDEPTPLALIQALKPDVLVKGSDYRLDEVVGAELVQSFGGRVHLATLREGYSTSGLLRRMKAA